jgi:hypothetical protein
MFYALKIAKYGTILNSFYQKKRKTVNHKPYSLTRKVTYPRNLGTRNLLLNVRGFFPFSLISRKLKEIARKF